MGSIGWGLDLASKINKQEPRIPKPTTKWLDAAKQSNFINFLQSKKNEINHQKQDYWHPQMFYITNNKSSVRSFVPATNQDLKGSAQPQDRKGRQERHALSEPRLLTLKVKNELRSEPNQRQT